MQTIFLASDGKTYDVVAEIWSDRVIIRYDGLFTFVDQQKDGTWEISAVPAETDEEKAILASLLQPTLNTTEVKVTSE